MALLAITSYIGLWRQQSYLNVKNSSDKKAFLISQDVEILIHNEAL